MSTLKLQTFWQNSLRSTNFKGASVMVGSTSKFSRAVMAFPRSAFLPTIYSNHAFLLKDITRPNPPQASGATNGIPSNSVSLLMTLGWSTLGSNTSTISAMCSRSSMGSSSTWLVTNLQVLTSHRIMQPARVASVCPATSRTFSSS
jgi:hypothetical protein